MYKNVNQNGCTYSDLFIFPNLKKLSPKEAMKKEWYVGCKFYDPTQKAKYPKGYFWRKKGLAEYKTFKEKKAAAELLLDEMQRALNLSYNPIPGICAYQDFSEGDFSPELYLIEALEMALQDHRNNISHAYFKSIESNLNTIKPVIIKLSLDKIPIKDIQLKHVKKVLDNSDLSAYSYNKFTKHLSKLFGILIANSCLIQNPCEYIPRKHHVKSERVILTQEKFDEIYIYLQENFEDYANYMQIFHMSGCRSTELLSVKRQDVNLEKQEVIVLVKKRNSYVREIRAIISDALPFWEKQVEKCLYDNDYLFGAGFSPELRLKPVTSDLPGKYWSRYVNKVFNTDTTFYSLKHLFLDKVAEKHGIQSAQKMAGHLNGKTTEIYTIFKEKRELEELKKISFK